ncbi:MAG: response regulator [Colwellia sp.]|nr:response regulator [Colwellia sp.]
MSINIRMNVSLVEILERNSFDRFTISQLKDAYLIVSGDECSVETRKFVYKQVLRLLNYKVLYKEGRKHSHDVTYTKTDLFSDVAFIGRKSKVNLILKPKSPKPKNISESALKPELENTLQQYKVDLMSAIGESEEYIRLLNSFPELKNVLSDNYHNARDKSSKLLGKIKAINTILSLSEQL